MDKDLYEMLVCAALEGILANSDWINHEDFKVPCDAGVAQRIGMLACRIAQETILCVEAHNFNASVAAEADAEEEGV